MDTVLTTTEDVLYAAQMIAEMTGMILVLDANGMRFITPEKFGEMIEG